MEGSSVEFESRLDNFESNLWSYHIKIPVYIVEYFRNLGIKRLLCSINGTEEFQTAITPAGQSVYFVNVNKKRRQTLDLVGGSPVHVQLMPDESTYGSPFPEEMRECFDQDPEGHRLFHALTPGKQRTLLFLIDKIKNRDKRIEKSIIILDHLKDSGGQLNFRELSDAFKRGL